MSHLLAISIGPVQEFIAAARRTRDLWFGSYLLSEVSKAAANAVRDAGGKLIFPASSNDSELDPGSDLNVANILLAEVGAGDPRGVADRAKKAAKDRWRTFADKVFEQYQQVIRDEIWRDQVDDVIEFYAAWAPLASDNYPDCRRKVMRLLAGRKNLRDFFPAKGRAGIPKSSLDGLRESVLRDPKDPRWTAQSRRPLRVRVGEQLDVIGVVKRAAEGHRPYPSVSRVAADPWLRGISKQNPKGFADLKTECRKLWKDLDLLRGVDDSEKNGYPHYKEFPYEGGAVYVSRHHELLEEWDPLESREILDPLKRALSRLGEPDPYLAVLVADGDRMGQALSQLETPDDHRAFSRQLSQFAGQAKEIVESKKHRGVLVYSGGDDVLAFVPVDQCLRCARQLHEKFQELMSEWAEKTKTEISLSVGVAIGHFLENLEDLLEYGRAAEKHAKRPRKEDGGQEERNALAVHVLKRGGSPIRVRASWTDELDERLSNMAKWINDRSVSGRVAYDLRRIADVYHDWEVNVSDAIQRDTISIMKGKEPAGESKMKEVKHLIRERVKDAASLRRLSDELLVARQIAVALRQAGAAAKSEGEAA